MQTSLLDLLEFWAGALGAVAGVSTLAIALAAIFRSLRAPAGMEERGARLVLSTPFLAIAAVAFFGIGALLWQPLPLVAPLWLRVVLLLAGGAAYFGGLALYLWGLRCLGAMFAPSSALGVRLHKAHRLVTSGPYAHIRHPMYLGVILAACGSLALYRTWATLGFAVSMLALVLRARREEKVLAQEFGAEWAAYAARVPGWMPRPRP